MTMMFGGFLQALTQQFTAKKGTLNQLTAAQPQPPPVNLFNPYIRQRTQRQGNLSQTRAASMLAQPGYMSAPKTPGLNPMYGMGLSGYL